MHWLGVLQQLHHDLLAIELVRSGLAAQQNAIANISLFDTDGTPISKSDFKDLGASRLILEQSATEAILGLTSNAIETFIIRAQRHANFGWEPFTKPRDDVVYAERCRQIRALHNVLKHQEGYVEANGGRSSRYLVANGYFPDETYLKHLPSETILPNAELTLYEAFGHLYKLTSVAMGAPDLVGSASGTEIIETLRSQVCYPILKTTIPPADSAAIR